MLSAIVGTGEKLRYDELGPSSLQARAHSRRIVYTHREREHRIGGLK